MATNVTAKTIKSAGSDTPSTDDASKATAKRTRKPIAPDQKTIIVRGVRRTVWTLLLAALDGDTDAMARLFGNVPPAAPERPTLSDDTKSDPEKVLAHVDALNAYASAVQEYPAQLEAFNTANLERRALRSGVNAALLDIPMRKRKSADAASTEAAS